LGVGTGRIVHPKIRPLVYGRLVGCTSSPADFRYNDFKKNRLPADFRYHDFKKNRLPADFGYRLQFFSAMIEDHLGLGRHLAQMKEGVKGYQ
jgi:hypothetical protein